MFKEQKGITLVALVITIIVLLILAGVSISLVVGEEGVLGRAQNSVSATERATADQEIQLSIAEAQMAYMEAWTGNQAVKKIDYYGNRDYYDRNCVSSANLVVTPNASTNKVKVTYTSKSQVVYTAEFDITAPSTSYHLTSNVAGV